MRSTTSRRVRRVAHSKVRGAERTVPFFDDQNPAWPSVNEVLTRAGPSLAQSDEEWLGKTLRFPGLLDRGMHSPWATNRAPGRRHHDSGDGGFGDSVCASGRRGGHFASHDQRGDRATARHCAGSDRRPEPSRVGHQPDTIRLQARTHDPQLRGTLTITAPRVRLLLESGLRKSTRL